MIRYLVELTNSILVRSVRTIKIGYSTTNEISIDESLSIQMVRNKMGYVTLLRYTGDRRY